VAGAILLGLIVIACSITGYVRRRIRYQLESRYSSAHTAWTNMIRATSNVEQSLRSDRSGLVNGRTVFTGASKDTLDAARRDWSFWSAQRAVAESTIKEAEDLRKRFSERKWWQLSHKPLKSAIRKLTDGHITVDSTCLSGGALSELAGLAPSATQTGTQLSAELETKGAQCRSTLERIQGAIRSAQSAEKRVRDTVTGQAPDNVVALKNRLGATQELPFDPYEAAFGEVNSSLETFCAQATGDPLTDFNGAERAVAAKINALRNSLLKALELFKSLLSYRESVRVQAQRVESLRRKPLNAGYPDALGADAELQYFRFAEDDDELNKQLDAASAKSEQLTTQLHAGEAGAFERTLPAAERAVREAKRIVDEVLAAKQAVDDQMNAILDNSTQADLRADSADSDAISALYTAQKWRAAQVSVAALFDLHKQRLDARAAVADLLQKQASNVLLLTRLSHIFSPATDEFSASIDAESARLKETSQLGRTDWHSLMRQVATVLESVCGPQETSLAEVIKRETSQYEHAQQLVRSLVNKLDDLLAKSGDNWGGAEAAEVLANTQPAVKQVEEQADVRKQDWVKLQFQAEGVDLQLKPAADLIGRELAADGKAFSLLTQLEADIAACQNMSYRRNVNGVAYGYGLYCHAAPALQLLETAYAAYQQRQYAEAQLEADKAQLVLFDSHLDTWWLCLQMMSMSADPAARQFAHQQGYSDYGMDLWKNLRTAETAAPIGSAVPAVTASQRYSLPLALDANATAAMAARDNALASPGDSPTVADYELRHAG
jgi:hypothetical protein